MQDLIRCLDREQPKINNYLECLIAKLPVSVRSVAQHILLAGGKRLRPLLCLLIGRLCQAPDEDLYCLGAAVEMLHAATLLHDDILDNAALRRGVVAAHTQFKVNEVVLTGDALLAAALLQVASFGDARLTSCIAQAVYATAAGEVMEMANLRNLALDLDSYFSIITDKTAWMLQAACELGALHGRAHDQVVQASASFGRSLGIAFQIVDDVLDFSPAEKTGKPMGGDLREGKITPPLLLYVRSLPAREAALFSRRFENGSLEEWEIEELCTKIREQGFTGAALSWSERHLHDAQEALHLLPSGTERVILQQMMDYVRQRSC